MKWRIAIGLVVLGALAAAASFGPTLLDYVRFERGLAAAAKAQDALGGPWPQLADACSVCHGQFGDSLNQHYPDLAAQPAPYLAAQLRAFASGQRASPFMASLALSLRDADIVRLAEEFSRQPATSNDPFVADPALRASGERLATSCASCHGEPFLGDALNPRLAGQGYDYLVAQMDDYATKRRVDATGAMNALAAALSEPERHAVATYLASFPVARREEVR